VVAVVTMTVGNLGALQQRDLVRLLAFSSVAQAGYILLPFGVARGGQRALDASRQRLPRSEPCCSTSSPTP
jgi:NADH-quinone oxidoreductase subunit N